MMDEMQRKIDEKKQEVEEEKRKIIEKEIKDEEHAGIDILFIFLREKSVYCSEKSKVFWQFEVED